MTTPPFRTILFAADFSTNSVDAFRVAASMALEGQARLIVLHGIDPDRPGGSNGHSGADIHAVLRRQLREVYLPNRPLQVEYLTSEGSPSVEILRVAGEVGCELIVMGTHGRTGLGRILMGNVAESILSRAECPVLVVKVSRAHDGRRTRPTRSARRQPGAAAEASRHRRAAALPVQEPDRPDPALRGRDGLRSACSAWRGSSSRMSPWPRS